MFLFSILAYLWFHVKNFFFASKNNLCPKKTSNKQNHRNRIRIYFPTREVTTNKIFVALPFFCHFIVQILYSIQISIYLVFIILKSTKIVRYVWLIIYQNLIVSFINNLVIYKFIKHVYINILHHES